VHQAGSMRVPLQVYSFALSRVLLIMARLFTDVVNALSVVIAQRVTVKILILGV
jgi:hypothetical protein